MSNSGILYNADGDYITEWVWWTPFVAIFILPAVVAAIQYGIASGIMFATPAIVFILMQKYMPV